MSFDITFKVRDYECDLQGVVNNGVYLNYLEHTRHEYLRSLDIDFKALHQEGIDPMVSRVEMDYKRPLTSGDEFISSLSVRKEGRLRIIFDQKIYRGEELVLAAKVIAVVVKNGRPVPPEQGVPGWNLEH
ncbi:acyl-CoA thioesterase [Spirochaeta cellobiosiphila]|uniref:acyl-CoA thioesterase n=1 Tax=Spirochaeta cellobiosiphila TaxID=504483 RepID=UPI0003FB203F|nr:thioesterase family protein [Spirochaeta cellobiosiphila]